MVSVHGAVFLEMALADSKLDNAEVHQLEHTMNKDTYTAGLSFSVEINKVLKTYSLCFQSGDIMIHDVLNAIQTLKHELMLTSF